MAQITESKIAARAEPASPLQEALPKEARPSEALPTEAGSWRLEGLLGEGGLARVFRARPIGGAADRPAGYALKILHPRWEQRPEMVALLRREATVGRSVSHPHLIAVLTAHVRESPYFVVLPRLTGQTLEARLKAGRPINLAVAIWIARQTAEAIAALHRGGFLHGDVKPANIFLAPSGHATLLDLSFARRLDETGSAVDRPLLGTINYLAPELLISALRADQRSDIYSLGVVLFEMLVARPPLVARDLAELIQKQRELQPPNLRALRPDLPQPLADLVRQMLRREPLGRPQSMDEIVQRLVALEIETLGESR